MIIDGYNHYIFKFHSVYKELNKLKQIYTIDSNSNKFNLYDVVTIIYLYLCIICSHQFSAAAKVAKKVLPLMQLYHPPNHPDILELRSMIHELK